MSDPRDAESEPSGHASPDGKRHLADGPASLPTHLAGLAETARDYAKAAASENTRRAYASDWRHYTGWARRQGLPALPPDAQVIGLYIAACASGATAGSPPSGKPASVATIERRLSALMWNFAQRGEPFDRADRHVATVLAGVRRTQGRPPEQKEAVLPEDLLNMIATLDLGELRGLRDRAILLIGFAGGLRRSEIVGLACHPNDALDGGRIEILPEGLLLTLRGKTGWREVEIGRGSSDATCPVVALQTWLKFARIERGPIFRRVSPDGKSVGADRLTDKHVARLVKQTAMAAGVRGDLSEGERAKKFSGHSLRAGLASSAEIDERYVQKQLGHTSAEMTRRYQRRRDRFRVNLTKTAGL
ncbi:MAG TPA: tyrosine-type recombinase/integrase [Roseiarcus sp.]|nr:tyrosine-type recombinase/integrase [Roseiarcus sp.]